jgi:copper resistance protein C
VSGVFRLLIPLALAFSPMSPAHAHAFLAGASPPVGSQLPASPAELTLRFTEPVEPLFCTIELRDGGNAAIRTAAPRVANDGQALVVTLPRLGVGVYTVIWHVTSVDTHKTEGRFQFTIGP